MKPAAGVIATRPAMAPVQNPTTDHLRSNRKSMINQVMALMSVSKLKHGLSHVTHPVDPAKLVLKIARAALREAAKHEPPLNPSHPTQSSIVPRTT